MIARRAHEPVLVFIQGVKGLVIFYSVEIDNFPTILGLLDLRKLRLNINLQQLQLESWKAEESNSLLSFYEYGDTDCRKLIEVPPAHDAVSGVAENKNDEELVQNAHSFFENETEHLSPYIKGQIWELFIRYKECWLRPRPGRADIAPVAFKVMGPPIKQKLRHLPEQHKAELDKQLTSMLANGVIRPSKSAWGSRPVFVQKKNRDWRLCLDFRQINRRMISDAYSLPLLWDNLQMAAHHNYYTCLDCNWGFWNIPLEEESKQYTALITHKGMFEFNVLPFGIKNSPAAFQRAMDTVFGDLFGQGILCYVDDIVIYANTIPRLLELLEEVLKRCLRSGFYLKFVKSDICKQYVTLLGHKVGRNGIMPDKNKVAAVRMAATPTSKNELLSFLGTISYLRRFIPHFAAIATPLYELTRKNMKWAWSEEADAAFEMLRDMLAEYVTLAAPRGTGKFVIATDASDKGIGCVLMQEQEGELVILEFASRKFTMPEMKWDTREREAFAIKWALEKFHDYVQIGEVLVVTDHESLKWMASSDKGKVQRWSLFLQQYDIEIRHISGKDNMIADWLSRAWRDEQDDNEIIDQMAVPLFAAELRKENPRVFAPVVPTVAEFKSALQAENSELFSGTYLGPDQMRYSTRTHKLYVPLALREAILWWFHASR